MQSWHVHFSTESNSNGSCRSLVEGFALKDASLKGKHITQIGIIVDNIEEAVQAWSALLGTEIPDIIITDPVERARTEYRGQASTARAKLAIIQLGTIALELIEPMGEGSTWKEQLDQYGPSIHHIAFQVDDIDTQLTSLHEPGLDLVQRGEFEGGRYAYLDGQEHFAAVIELLEID